MLSTRHDDDSRSSGGAKSLLGSVIDSVAAPGLKARAESDAIRLRSEAEAKKIDAECDALKAEAEKARNETAAVKLRAAAEAKKMEVEVEKLRNESAAVKMQAEAEVKKMEVKKVGAEINMSKWRLGWRLACSFLLMSAGAWLVYDFKQHEDVEYIEANMRRLLLARLEAAQAAARAGNATAAATPIRVYEALAVLPSDKGIMLMGSTGSGKSTLMQQRMQQAMQATDGSAMPAILLRLRERRDQKVGSADTEQDAYQQLHSLVVRLQQEMGFPTRRWLPLYLQQEIGITLKTQFVTLDTVAASDRARLMMAFDCLFRVCASMPRSRPTRPGALVLIDEVQDLCCTDRLGAVGGRHVFQQLAATIVRYTNDLRAVHVIVAGSSALLAHEFESTTASGHRWVHRTAEDPSMEDVLAALAARNYTPEQVAAIVDTVGLRLRLLTTFLDDPLSPEDVTRTCRDALVCAKTAINQLFESATKLGVSEDRVRALLRRVARSCLKGEAVELREIPHVLRSAEVIGKVLYVVYGDTVGFQSRAVERAWKLLDEAHPV